MKRRPPMVARSPVLLLLLLAVMVGLRTRLVDHTIGTYLACPGCFDTMVLTADSMLFAAVAGLLLLAGMIRFRWPGYLLHFTVALALLVYAADLVVFRLFNSRLFLSDASLFLAEPAAVWNQFTSGFGGSVPAVALLAGFSLALLWPTLARPVRSRAQRLMLSAVLAISLIAAALTGDRVYVNDWAVENVFAANLATGEHTRYSDDVASETLASRPPPRIVAGPAPGRGRDVIVVLLESWSAWHSAAWGGYQDWTPRLDAAASRGEAYTEFHAIGFSTDKGLVGLLAGQQIWSPFLHFMETPPFHSMWGVKRTLPRAFTPHGYHTAFLTSGPLTLYRKGEWLSDLGFVEVEGNEHPFYANEKRYAFGAASDSALYARAGEWLRDTASPFLLVLETVTTHQPYSDPESGERSLERAMRYADRAFGEFLDGLDASGYFDHGILLVASDHRSMTPVPAHELEAWGPAALSRVPVFVIGPGFTPGIRHDSVYSQSDLVPSFELWLAGATELEAHQDVMFGRHAGSTEPAAAAERCAFHSRIDLRGRVDVHCGNGRGRVLLDGDDSRFIEVQYLGPARQSELLATLAALRLEGLARHRRK